MPAKSAAEIVTVYKIGAILFNLKLTSCKGDWFYRAKHYITLQISYIIHALLFSPRRNATCFSPQGN